MKEYTKNIIIEGIYKEVDFLRLCSDDDRRAFSHGYALGQISVLWVCNAITEAEYNELGDLVELAYCGYACE